MLALPSHPSIPDSLSLPMPALSCLLMPTLSSFLVPALSSLSVPVTSSYSLLDPAPTYLYLQLSEHSNETSQMSLCAAIQLAPALQDLFIRFRLSVYCLKKTIASGLLTWHS